MLDVIFPIIFNDCFSVGACFIFMPLDQDLNSLSNQEPILTVLHSFGLVIKLYNYHCGSITLRYFILYYIILHYMILLNCIIVDSFISLYHYYLFSTAFYKTLSIFIFNVLLVQTFFCQILVDLKLHLLFYLVFVLL